MGDHWKALANKLGAPGVDAPSMESAPQAKEETNQPAPHHAPTASTYPAPASQGDEIELSFRAKPKPPRTEAPSQASAVQASPAAQPATPVARETAIEAPAAPAASNKTDKPKRKSSWDQLTSFFGISSPASEEAPADDVSSSAPAETDALLTPRQEPSPPSALDALFGDAPRQELSWEKPKPRRMIDDVSSWEDEPIRVDDDDDPRAMDPQALNPEARALSGDETTDEASAPTRRRRRRRRGGRRDRDDAPRTSDRDELSSASDKHEPAGSGDAWDEEDVVDAVESSEQWDEPTTFESDAGEVEETNQPERRSSRRRRRGRGRGREAGAPVDELDSTREAEPRSPRQREPRPEGLEPRPVREPKEPRDESVSERPRREGRSRRSRPADSDAPRRELAAVNAENDEIDTSLTAELEEGGPNRHPKIPTWVDSLEAIISANMENHRRLDSQRGGPSRGGRPRNGGGNNPGSGPGPRR